jgi:protein-tyrosine phosphatase
MQQNRKLQLEGADNFREIGGLKTQNGIMKSGLLFRSDDLSALSKKDLLFITALNLKTIIDLRTPNEIKYKPDKLPTDNFIKSINVPFFHQKRDYNQLQIMWFLVINSKKINFEKFIKEHYLNNAFDRAVEVGKVFKIISDPDNLPALIHCKAGKDRTGLISALIQVLAGVPRETIIEEYLATNHFMKQKMDDVSKVIRKMSLFRATHEKIRPLLEVRRPYLEEVLDEILRRYITYENYLQKACGLKAQEIDGIRTIICA